MSKEQVCYCETACVCVEREVEEESSGFLATVAKVVIGAVIIGVIGGALSSNDD